MLDSLNVKPNLLSSVLKLAILRLSIFAFPKDALFKLPSFTKKLMIFLLSFEGLALIEASSINKKSM